MHTGLLDGKSALEIQMEHPSYQIFNPTNFPNNVSCLQSKLGLESAATVTFVSPQVVPSHSPPPLFVQAHPCLESQAMQPLHDPCLMSLPMVTVRSKQRLHGNVSLGTNDDCFRLSGHLKLELPYIMDEWSDGEHSFLSFQIAQLAGPPMKWYMSTDGKSLIGDYKASRNLVDPEKALSGFVDKNKKKLYEKMHGRYVTRKLLVREIHDDEMEQVLMRQVIHLPFPCETRFIVKEKKDLHYVKFSNGEVSLFLHLVEVGGHPDTAPCPPPAVPAPPASILYVSNSVAPDMDELTHNVRSGAEFLFLLLIEVSDLVVEAGWNGHGGLLQNQICQILLNHQVLFKRCFVKFMSLILWEMQSCQRRPMVMLLQEQPQLLQLLSLL